MSKRDDDQYLDFLRYSDKPVELPKVTKADLKFMGSRAAKREVKAQAKEDRKRGRG